MKFLNLLKPLSVFALALFAAGLGNAQAATMYTDLGAWEAAAGTSTETTIVGQNFATVSGVTLNDGTTLGFNEALNIATIGNGWATWCCSYTGEVTGSNVSGAVNSETWSISSVSGFGMFIEPDTFADFDITVLLSSSDVLTRTVNGTGGALFFGWIGSGITGLTISSTSDFAEGDWFTTGASASVPEPITLSLFGAGLAGAAALRRRKKKSI